MGKIDIIEVVKGRYQRPSTDALNLLLAGSGKRNYTTNNPSFPSPASYFNGGFIMSDLPEKVCNTCGFSFPLTGFYKCKNNPDGLQNTCKKCWRTRYASTPEKIAKAYALTQAWREANKEHVLDYSSTYHKTHAEKISIENKLYKEINSNRLIEYRAKRYAANPEKFLNRNKEYSITHPERITAIQNNRRSMKKNSFGKITAKDITIQSERQKGKCYYCQKKMGSSKTIEHVIPLARGGTNDPSNMVLACKHCNSSKSKKLPHEWPQGGRLI